MTDEPRTRGLGRASAWRIARQCEQLGLAASVHWLLQGGTYYVRVAGTPLPEPDYCYTQDEWRALRAFVANVRRAEIAVREAGG